MKSSKLTNSAKGKNCTLRIPGICNHDPSTVVACHGPDTHRGKAMKAPDFWMAYGCSDCHAALDLRQVEDWATYWLQGILETQKQLVEAGLIFIPENQKREKKSPKIMPRKGMYA